MVRVFSFGLLLLFWVFQIQAKAQIAKDRAYQVIMADLNGVRVFRVEVEAKGTTELHRQERDYFWVTIGDADILDEIEGKEPIEIRLKNGEVRFRKGGFAHTIRNLSTQPFRNITMEIPEQSPAQARITKKVPEQVFKGGSVKIVLARDGVKVSEINLEPGATVPNHHYDGRHLVVGITDVDLRGDVDGMDPMPLKLKAGEIGLLPGGYTNVGQQPARFVTVAY